MSEGHSDCEITAERRANDEERSAGGEKANLPGGGVDLVYECCEEDPLVEMVRRSVVAHIQAQDVIACSNQRAAQDEIVGGVTVPLPTVDQHCQAFGLSMREDGTPVRRIEPEQSYRPARIETCPVRSGVEQDHLLTLVD